MSNHKPPKSVNSEGTFVKKLSIAIGAAIAVAGCTPEPAKVTQEPVSAAVKRGTDTKRFAQGTTQVVIRAYKKNADGKTSSEVVGAKCKVESDELLAEVITPQAVIVPNFRQNTAYPNRGLPSALLVNCKADALRGTATAASNEKQVATAVGGGLLAAVVSTAVSVAVANSTPWIYPTIVKVPMQ